MLVPIKNTDKESISKLKVMVIACYFLMKISKEDHDVLYSFLERLEKALN